MTRLALLGILAWGLGGCTAGPLASARTDSDPIVARAARSVVQVLARTPRGPHARGSGVVVGGRRVVTAAHVLAGAQAWDVENSLGQRVAVARVERVDRARDAAWLELDEAGAAAFDAQSVTVAPAAPSQGEAVFALGARGGAWRSTVTVASTGAPLFAFHGARPGDSGGAVFDSAGRLVGMILARGHLAFALALAPEVEPRREIAWPASADGWPDGLLWGVLASRAGEWKRAVAFLEAAAVARPEDPDAEFLLARARLGAGDADGAARAFHRLCEKRPDDPFAWNDLGLAHSAAGRTGEAVESLRRALRLDPVDREIRWNLWAALKEQARVLRAQGKEVEAERADAERRVIGPGAAEPPGGGEGG